MKNDDRKMHYFDDDCRTVRVGLSVEIGDFRTETRGLFGVHFKASFSQFFGHVEKVGSILTNRPTKSEITGVETS